MKEVKNIPASINARIQNLAHTQNESFQRILQYYCIERFLFRLSQTNYSNLFVLKGGLIFYALGYHFRRPTRDIDLRGFTNNSAQNLLNILGTAFEIPNENDGLSFDKNSIRFEEITTDADYRGVRVSFEAYLGKARIPLKIDIGFSDEIIPGIQKIIYPVLLNEMEAPRLQGYPLESIISEKFHAMVRLDEINSRWKDFYDIWMLSEMNSFSGELLQKAIQTTFAQRETPIPTSKPVALTNEFALSHQKDWQIFIKKNKLSQDGVEDFSKIISKLSVFMLPPVESLSNHQLFRKNWVAGLRWE